MSGGIYNKVTGYHNRRSIRLRGYDYSRPGSYFVTICIRDWKQCLFGDVANGEMVLNELGICANTYWLDIPHHFPNVQLDEYVIMPNHVHGIIVITNSALQVGRDDRDEMAGNDEMVGRDDPAPTLGSIIAWFSYQSTKRINVILSVGVRKIWQRNYYDHIIRDRRSLLTIRRYIRKNPIKWEEDKNKKHSAVDMDRFICNDVE